MNVGEYGHILYFHLQEDVSANTNKVILKGPDGNETEKAATLGTTELAASTTGKGIWSANQWVQYTIASDDLDQVGLWQFKATSEFSGTKKLESDWKRHKVKG